MSPVFRDLVSFVTRIRRRLLRRTVWALALWAAVGIGALLVVAWVTAHPAEAPGRATPVPVLLDLLIVATVAGAVGAYRWSRERWMAEGRVTRMIEESSGLAAGTLRGSVELARDLPGGVSDGLAEAGARSLLLRLRESGERPEGELGRRLDRWTRRAAGALTVVTVFLIGLGVARPDRIGAALASLSAPLKAWSGPTFPPLQLFPENTEVLRGSDVEVTVRAPGREGVTLRWSGAGELSRERELAVEAGVARHVLPGVRARTEFWVEAPDGASSERFVLTPIDPLLVSELTVTVDFPPHTGRFTEEYRGVVPPLELPTDSRIRIEGRASRALAEAALQESDAEVRIPLQVEDSRFHLEWTPGLAGRFEWAFTDEGGRRPELAPAPLEISLIADRPPEIEILMPGRDTVLAASGRQPLVIESGDDYGVRRIELVAWRVSALGERDPPVVRALEMARSRSALVRPVMDLSSWNLLIGDTVRYFARAVDNNPAEQVTVTPEYVLRPPDRSDLRREARERLEAAEGELEELVEESAERAEEMRDREREAVAREARSEESRGGRTEEVRFEFDEREVVRRALEDRREMVSGVDSVTAELEAMQEELAELADSELQDSLAELQALMEEMTPEDARERLQEMSERVESMDPEEMDEAFGEMAEDQEAMRDRMEEALERLRRATLEQEFRATGQEAEALARQEERLARAMAEGERPERRAEQQAELQERTGELQERLEALSRELDEVGDEARREAVDRGASRGREASRAMDEAGRRAVEGRMEEAAEKAQEAARRMQEMADELQQAQEQMNEEMMQALQQAYRQTSNDALALAREQSALRERMRGASTEELAGLRSGEGALLEGVEQMAANLATMNRMTGNDDTEISGAMGEAMQAVEETMAALQDQRGRTPSPYSAAERAIQTLNEVAMTAMQNARQLGQGAEGQNMTERMMQQMQKLAREQSQVNEQTGQMTPMEPGEEAMQEQMQEAAQSQQQVADELGQVSRESDPESRNLGDVEAMAEEARALAEMLEGGRLDGRLRDRQQRLFHRLLDAGRSLERDEETEEREAERPGEFEREMVLPLSAEELAIFRFRTPTAAELRGLSPAERLMVHRYFERLNRVRRSGGGGEEGS